MSGEREMGQETNIWEHFQSGAAETFAGSQARLAFLAGLFKPGARVLNIGAGNGRFEELCLRRGADVYALDPGPATIDALRRRLGLGDKAVTGVSDKIPFGDAFFDAVVMSEVLEHLEPAALRATLAEARRVLRPGGRFTGTVPCGENLAEQETMCPKCGERFHRWGHKLSFSARSLTAALAEYFPEPRVEKKLFVTWGTLNWRGRLQGALNYVLLFSGLLGDSRLNLFFDCQKRAPRA